MATQQVYSTHPLRFTDTDLSELGYMAGRIASMAPAYTAWLAGIVSVELGRRASEDAIEPTLSEIPVNGWTDGALLDALLAASILAPAARKQLSPAAAEVIQHNLEMIVAETRRRWRNQAPARPGQHDEFDRVKRINSIEQELDVLLNSTFNAGPDGWQRHAEVASFATQAEQSLKAEPDRDLRQRWQWIADYASMKSNQMEVAYRDTKDELK